MVRGTHVGPPKYRHEEKCLEDTTEEVFPEANRLIHRKKGGACVSMPTRTAGTGSRPLASGASGQERNIPALGEGQQTQSDRVGSCSACFITFPETNRATFLAESKLP